MRATRCVQPGSSCNQMEVPRPLVALQLNCLNRRRNFSLPILEDDVDRLGGLKRRERKRRTEERLGGSEAGTAKCSAVANDDSKLTMIPC